MAGLGGREMRHVFSRFLLRGRLRGRMQLRRGGSADQLVLGFAPMPFMAAVPAAFLFPQFIGSARNGVV